jgi:hypothetical protein
VQETILGTHDKQPHQSFVILCGHCLHYALYRCCVLIQNWRSLQSRLKTTHWQLIFKNHLIAEGLPCPLYKSSKASSRLLPRERHHGRWHSTQRRKDSSGPFRLRTMLVRPWSSRLMRPVRTRLCPFAAVLLRFPLAQSCPTKPRLTFLLHKVEVVPSLSRRPIWRNSRLHPLLPHPTSVRENE